MSLSPGSRLGPYEIVALLGVGGMGEVYRARDARLAREVAIKVIPASVATDPERVHRFEVEACAAGQLNHPNILAIYDIGTHNGSPYIVSELLEGETLRERLTHGPLTVLKATEFAVQIAHGLIAAHDKGIVHRDLKPENLFITRDDRVKILDFGLAKLTASNPIDEHSLAPTVLPTEPGTVMGTAAYMSPEQARAETVDHRTDMFSFGSILYEVLSGNRAFRGDSAVETMNAILKEEPAELSVIGHVVPPGLERILRHCLEKRPDGRWQTARDLAFALEALSGGAATVVAAAPSEHSSTVSRADLRWIALAAAVVVLTAIGLAVRVGPQIGSPSPLAFQRLTFSRGTVWSARFAPEGGTIIYSATWDGKRVELFSTRSDGPESRALGISGADVAGISRPGEMALLLKPGSSIEWAWKWGTLARASLAGGAPRELLTGVQLADWGPDGATLAEVRAVGLHSRVEFPMGKALYETPDRIGALRVSRRGDLLGIAERPPGLSGRWSIATLDLNGTKTTLSAGWPGDFIDLAWSPTGEEIWFDTRQGGDDSLHAVTLSGKHRLITRMAVPVQLFDVSRAGRVLLARTYWRSGILGLPPSATREQDLSWLDASEVDDISDDGTFLLITEFGEGGGAGRGSVYLRKVDGSPAVRLGDGQAFALSPDANRALALRRTTPPELVLWPTGAGEPIVLKNANISDYTWAGWLPDGKRIVFSAAERGHSPRCYLQDIAGGPPRPITPEGTTLLLGQKVVSPDGEWIAVIGTDGAPSLYPIAGGQPRLIPGVEPGDVPVRWSADERSLFVFRKIEETPRVYLIDLASGEKQLWKEIRPPDIVGIANVWGVHVGPDDRSYYYSYMRNLSDLYLMDGFK